MVFANVNVNGQITLPKEIRKKLDIEPGSTVEIVEKNNGRFEVKKAVIIEAESLKKLAELAKRKGITHAELVKACREIGEETYAAEYGD
ncbi:AbrB/MazE/SpoVT family DNA-binding domain-containing protein [Candidatus Micrarchaeota archaeon]|nr:AbrB/MazE/SpoVT family DNA-binding domain-containing protein [Candidatus Micrarchaeota archaeon]